MNKRKNKSPKLVSNKQSLSDKIKPFIIAPSIDTNKPYKPLCILPIIDTKSSNDLTKSDSVLRLIIKSTIFFSLI